MPEPIIVRGVLGWSNPVPPPNFTSFTLYGPGGRWDKARGIEDALVSAGASEGAEVVLVARNRFEIPTAAEVEPKIYSLFTTDGDVETRLVESRRAALRRGHDWDVADVMAVLLGGI